MKKYRYDYVFRKPNGKVVGVRGMTLYDTREQAEEASLDSLALYEEEGCKAISHNVVEVEE